MSVDLPPDTPQDVLFRRVRDQDCPEARELLVRRYLGLARGLAARYQGRNEPLEDLRQVAVLGLLRAVDRFDPDRGYAFSSLAVPTILGEIRRHFRDHTWQVRVPRSLQERVAALNRARGDLAEKLGRAPTTAELAERLAWTEEDVLDAAAARMAQRAASLDAPAASSPVHDPAPLWATVGGEDPRLAFVELAASLRPALAALPALDRRVLALRVIEDLTQSEIAARVGVSQMQVSRILRRTYRRLRPVEAACLAGAGPGERPAGVHRDGRGA
jgi:RNA polymerase sigma-B factor